MRILLTGATGFIGRRLAAALLAQGHRLRCVSRSPAPQIANAGAATWVQLDFARMTSAAHWVDALEGCDVVINAAGILRSQGSNTLERVHAEAPCALFQAARARGIERVIHISALGADEAAASAYHRTKKAGDDCLRRLGIAHCIVQPSLVFGLDGASAQLFMRMAAMPVIPLPGRGEAMIQPVHIDDLVQAVLALLRTPAADMPPVLAVTGPSPMTLRAYYAGLRDAMRIAAPARFLPVPAPAMRLAARAGDRLGLAMLNSETLGMLARGNTGDPRPLTRLLGREPRAPQAFLDADCAAAVGARARMAWLLPLLRASIAFVWIVTAIVSAFGYPLSESHDLLRRAGVPDAMLAWALYGAIALDLLFGVAVLWPRRPRWIWVAQALLVIGYTAIISVRLPEFWLHPYGPIVKNAPFLAALWLLYEMDEKPWKS